VLSDDVNPMLMFLNPVVQPLPPPHEARITYLVDMHLPYCNRDATCSGDASHHNHIWELYPYTVDAASQSGRVRQIDLKFKTYPPVFLFFDNEGRDASSPSERTSIR
jgi:hypothetical protein